MGLKPIECVCNLPIKKFKFFYDCSLTLSHTHALALSILYSKTAVLFMRFEQSMWVWIKFVLSSKSSK